MAEKLENLEAEGRVKVESQEERVARLRDDQQRERQYKIMKEQMDQRKAALKKTIELMELEVRNVQLHNLFTEGRLRRLELDEIIKAKGLDKPNEADDKDTDTEG